MAEHHKMAPVELGASMDYPEHEQTYSGFVTLIKWATIALVALMTAMAFGFFVGGFISAVIVFILVCVAAWFIL